MDCLSAVQLNVWNGYFLIGKLTLFRRVEVSSRGVERCDDQRVDVMVTSNE